MDFDTNDLLFLCHNLKKSDKLDVIPIILSHFSVMIEGVAIDFFNSCIIFKLKELHWSLTSEASISVENTEVLVENSQGNALESSKKGGKKKKSA